MVVSRDRLQWNTTTHRQEAATRLPVLIATDRTAALRHVMMDTSAIAVRVVADMVRVVVWMRHMATVEARRMPQWDTVLPPRIRLDTVVPLLVSVHIVVPPRLRDMWLMVSGVVHLICRRRIDRDRRTIARFPARFSIQHVDVNMATTARSCTSFVMAPVMVVTAMAPAERNEMIRTHHREGDNIIVLLL